MPLSRRAFLQQSGLLAAYALFPTWLSSCGDEVVAATVPDPHARSGAAPLTVALLPSSRRPRCCAPSPASASSLSWGV